MEHSFFIPDVEYLSDLEGFILYLVEKTTLARLCITCNRGFETAEAAHQHMADKGHTMIKYETVREAIAAECVVTCCHVLSRAVTCRHVPSCVHRAIAP